MGWGWGLRLKRKPGGDWANIEIKHGKDRVQKDEANKACWLTLQTPQIVGNLCVFV